MAIWSWTWVSSLRNRYPYLLGAQLEKPTDSDFRFGTGIKGRGRGTSNRRETPGATSHGSPVHDRPAPSKATRSTRVDQTPAQRILRAIASKEPKRLRGVSRLVRKDIKEDGISGSLDQIKVYGLKESKAASNPGGGVKDLLDFLERKATAPNAPSREAVRIRKVCLTSQSAGSHRRRSLALSGPLSFHAKLPERRPRYPSHAASDFNGTCNFKVICLANVV